MAELAARYHVGRPTVRAWLQRAGIPIRTQADTGRRRVLRPPPAAQLQRLVDDGLPIPQLAQRLGVSQTTAKRWLQDADITPAPGSLKDRPRGASRPLTRPSRGKLAQLYTGQGLPIAAIAEQLGVSSHLVRSWLLEAGITIRAAGGRPGTKRTKVNRKPVPPAEELRQLQVVQRLGRQEIARRYQVHPATVSNWLRDAALPTHRPPCPGTLSAPEMVELYRTRALSAAEIGRLAGVPASRVLRALQAAGVPIDPTRQKQAVRAAGHRRADRPALPAADGDWAEARYRVDGWSYRRIAEALDVPVTKVRRALAQRAVPTRRLRVPGRAARQEAPVDALRHLYVDSHRTAEDIAGILDINSHVVFRTGHAHGLPIRQGGRPVVSATVELIDGLYADPTIAAVLDRHHVPRRPPGGGIAHRFPQPVPLTPELLRDLYLDAGCSSPQIELLTGQAQVIVRARMHDWDIPIREQHPSPALLRLREAARARFLTGIVNDYRRLGSTTKVAQANGVAPGTVLRWLHIAGVHVPGRGRWPRPERGHEAAVSRFC